MIYWLREVFLMEYGMGKDDIQLCSVHEVHEAESHSLTFHLLHIIPCVNTNPLTHIPALIEGQNTLTDFHVINIIDS